MNEWHIEHEKCPVCGYPLAVYGTREVSWTMYVPSFMGDEEYETATRTESYFSCPNCGLADVDPATY